MLPASRKIPEILSLAAADRIAFLRFSSPTVGASPILPNKGRATGKAKSSGELLSTSALLFKLRCNIEFSFTTTVSDGVNTAKNPRVKKNVNIKNSTNAVKTASTDLRNDFISTLLICCVKPGDSTDDSIKGFAQAIIVLNLV